MTDIRNNGYLGMHMQGSRKETVHKLFDTKGAEEAKAWGIAEGLKESTLNSWISTWSKSHQFETNITRVNSMGGFTTSASKHARAGTLQLIDQCLEQPAGLVIIKIVLLNEMED
jgi:hypothetical protein